MHLFRKGQLEGIAKRDILAQHHIINQLFGLAAEQKLASLSLPFNLFLQHNRSNCIGLRASSCWPAPERLGQRNTVSIVPWHAPALSAAKL
jgi:hypothetical protein